MNAADLITQLAKLPAGIPVYVASDEEGNDFHPVYEVTLEDELDNVDDTVAVIWP